LTALCTNGTVIYFTLQTPHYPPELTQGCILHQCGCTGEEKHPNGRYDL